MSSNRAPRDPFTRSLIFQIAAAFLASGAATLFLVWAAAEWTGRDEPRDGRMPRPGRFFRALLHEQIESADRDDPEAWRALARRFPGARLRVERNGTVILADLEPPRQPLSSSAGEPDEGDAPPAPGSPPRMRCIDRDGFRIHYVTPAMRKPFHPLHQAAVFLFMAITTFGFLFLYMRRVLAPLREMIRVTRALSHGDLSARLPEAKTREFDILFRSFNDMTAKLQAVLANHRLMLGNLAHDLKHHLGRIRLTVELDVPDPAARAALEEEVAAIDGYLDRTREAIRAVDGRALYRVEPGDLSVVAREMAAEAGVPAECAPGVRAATDPMFFPLLLRNLLDNAKRHGSDPRLRLTSAGGAFTLEVDNLPAAPLSADELELLFQPYYRGDHARRVSNGSGLGLFIVRGIADAHGFDIRLELTPEGRFLARLTGPLA